MTIGVAPTQAAALRALGDFLREILPEGVVITVGQTNRVPEPKAANFVAMTPTRRERLRTNIDSSADVRFTGSIAGTTMTVTDVSFGTILVGANVFGVDVEPNTTIEALGTGSGGAGTYVVDPAQTVGEEVLASGAQTVEQGTGLNVQIDVHGPASADNAQIISTLMRDAFAVERMAGTGVAPLYADDPMQLPFTNAEQQVEDRWTVQAMLQCNPVVSIPRQYADSASVELISVDAEYPP